MLQFSSSAFPEKSHLTDQLIDLTWKRCSGSFLYLKCLKPATGEAFCYRFIMMSSSKRKKKLNFKQGVSGSFVASVVCTFG